MFASRGEYAVLIPVHKVHADVYACFDSVLSDIPNYVSVYCVLHNPDASLRQFVCNYPKKNRIIILEKNCHTLGMLLNFGLQNIEEPWVFRMDSDDVWLSGRFESQISFLNENRDVWVLGGAIEVFDSIRNLRYKLYENQEAQVFKKDLLEGCPIPHPSTLLNRQKILDIGGYNENYEAAEDYELWSRVVFHGKILRQNEVLIRYSINEAGNSILKKHQQKVEAELIKLNIYLRRLNLPTVTPNQSAGSLIYRKIMSNIMQLFTKF
jgi:hypothetical protein